MRRTACGRPCPAAACPDSRGAQPLRDRDHDAARIGLPFIILHSGL